MFLNRRQDKIIQYIERRIALFSHIPVEHREGKDLKFYGMKKYEPHMDYFNDPFNTKNGGERPATMHADVVEEGGETVFPAANANFSDGGMNVERWMGLSVKPKMGNAVLFWSTKPDGEFAWELSSYQVVSP